MSVFNSLGSNYTFGSAVRILFSPGGSAPRANLAAYLEARYGGSAVLTYKGREAIALALGLMDGSGSAAVNGYTCYAVWKAVADAGWKTAYADIENGGLDFSLRTLEALHKKNPSLKAVIVQNTLGYPADVPAIATYCRKNSLALIEDLAHSIGTVYANGEEAGTLGDFVILSFSQDKVVDGVSGGALIVRNKKYAERLGREKAVRVDGRKQLKDRWYPLLTVLIRRTHASGFGKGLHKLCRAWHMLPQPLSLNATGALHRLPEWQCQGILRGFHALEKNLSHRREIARLYADTLDSGIAQPIPEKELAVATCLRYPILVTDRGGLVSYLRSRQIYVSDIWYDAPVAPKKYQHMSDYAGTCPQAEKTAETMLNLPTHLNVSAAEARRIVAAVNQWCKRIV